MFYTIKHETIFRYSALIRESVMEVRMQPRSEGPQRCLSFQLNILPRPSYTAHSDCWGNVVHHFDIPGQHQELDLTAHSIIEMEAAPELPESLDKEGWKQLDEEVESGDFYDFLLPSKFARPSEKLKALMKELRATRRDDPLSLLRELNSSVYAAFQYLPESTRADSPIDEALEGRAGVCQDFTHIFITMARELGIPARYVSGYLHQEAHHHDRSLRRATHAWAECLLPELGWIGFDPTNDLVTAERHIRTAIGRDYADVPPTRGVYKGKAETELEVSVEVDKTDAPPREKLSSFSYAPRPVEVTTPIASAIWPPPAASLESVTEQAQQ